MQRLTTVAVATLALPFYAQATKGLASAANNPATLRLQTAGARLDLAIGHLRPRVSSRTVGAHRLQ